MNSWTPISGFDRPSRASLAMCASCVRELIDGFGRARADGRARGQQLAAGPLGETLHSHGGEHVVGEGELPAGVGPAVLPAEPLPVEQVSAGELAAHPGPAEVRDGFAETALGGVPLAQQRSRARLDAEHPIGPGHVRLRGQPLEGLRCQVGPAGSRGCLDQLDHAPVVSDHLRSDPHRRGGPRREPPRAGPAHCTEQRGSTHRSRPRPPRRGRLRRRSPRLSVLWPPAPGPATL